MPAMPPLDAARFLRDLVRFLWIQRSQAAAHGVRVQRSGTALRALGERVAEAFLRAEAAPPHSEEQRAALEEVATLTSELWGQVAPSDSLFLLISTAASLIRGERFEKKTYL